MNLYTVLGEQVVLCEKKIAEILEKHQLTTADMNRYDMRETPIQNALFDLQTVPFLCPKKAVLVKNPEFLTGKESKNQIHDINLLSSFLENPITDNIMIIHAPYEKLDERKKLVKLLKKKSEFIKLEKKTEESLKQWVKNRLMDKKIDFEADAIQLLINLTQAKIDLLNQELEKIDLYFLSASRKKLTTEIVQLIVNRQLDDNVFLLTDALTQHKVKEAYRIYQDLLAQNEDPFKLLILIGTQFRLMKHIIQLNKQGYTEANIAKILGVHPYRVKVIGHQAQRFKLEVIEAYIYQISQMDYKIKTGSLQKELAIELLILNLKC